MRTQYLVLLMIPFLFAGTYNDVVKEHDVAVSTFYSDVAQAKADRYKEVTKATQAEIKALRQAVLVNKTTCYEAPDVCEAQLLTARQRVLDFAVAERSIAKKDEALAVKEAGKRYCKRLTKLGYNRHDKSAPASLHVIDYYKRGYTVPSFGQRPSCKGETL